MTSTSIRQQFNDQNTLTKMALADCREVKTEIQSLKTLVDGQISTGDGLMSAPSMVSQLEISIEALKYLNSLQYNIYSDMQRLLSQPEQHAYLVEQLEVMNTKIQELAETSSSTLLSHAPGSDELLSGQNKLLLETSHLMEKLDGLAADVRRLRMDDIRSRSTGDISDVLAEVVRAELRTNLKTLLEQSLVGRDITFRAALAQILESVKSTESSSLLGNDRKTYESTQHSNVNLHPL